MPEAKKKNIISQEKSLDNTSQPPAVDFGTLIMSLVESIAEEKEEIIKNKISYLVKSELLKFDRVFNDYHVLIQYDENSMARMDADNIYKALKSFPFEEKKDILLILYSFGGDIASAYLISKLCREFAKRKVIVAIPRLAKSAATLICCGADEIHMGSLSELGPLDPQINRLPALGLKNTIRQIAETVTVYPKSSQLFADYIAKTIPPIDLGYFDRIVESASQYAQRLLQKRNKKQDNSDIQRIANRLVYDYSDHGFVIDKNEALEIFGEDIVKIDTPEYYVADAIYSLLSFISQLCSPKYKFYFIGNCELSDSVGLMVNKQK